MKVKNKAVKKVKKVVTIKIVKEFLFTEREATAIRDLVGGGTSDALADIAISGYNRSGLTHSQFEELFNNLRQSLNKNI